MSDKETDDYYEHQLVMFESPGWKYFTDQVRDMRAATDTLKGVTLEKLVFNQGELSIMDWILNWPSAVRMAYQTKDAKPEAEPEVDPEG
jgi:hypothetical protein